MDKVNLVEILHPKMEILFVALNPPVISNGNGHYFSNNLSFWNLMFNSELIIQPVINKLSGDDEVFRNNSINYKNAVFGITDLVHDIVETQSNKIKVERLRVDRTLKILDFNKVNVMCLVHSKVANAFQDRGLIDISTGYGKVGEYKKTLIYYAPFHNAPIREKEQYYKLLKVQL